MCSATDWTILAEPNPDLPPLGKPVFFVGKWDDAELFGILTKDHENNYWWNDLMGRGRFGLHWAHRWWLPVTPQVEYTRVPKVK